MPPSPQPPSKLSPNAVPTGMVADRKAVDHLAILGGADLNVLRHVPSERGGFVSLGLVMLATAGVAAVSMMFALQHAVLVDIDPVSGLPYPSQPLWISVVSLILGPGPRQRHAGSPWAPGLGVLPTPSRACTRHWDRRLDAHHAPNLPRRNCRRDAQGTEQRARRRKQSSSQRQDSQGPSREAGRCCSPGEDPSRRWGGSEQSRGEASAGQGYEPHGGCCGGASNQAGKGNLYVAAKSAYDSAVTDLNRKQGELETAKAELADAQGKALQSAGPVITGQKVEARRQLCGKESNPQTLDTSPCHYADNANATGLRAQVAKLERDQSGMVDAAAIRQSGGLLSQLAALTTLSSQNTGAAWAHWMVAALFMLIELLPVLVKIMTAFRGESQSDRVFKRLQDDELDDASQGFDERGADRDREAQKREAIANDMLTRQVELGKMANQIVADEMVGVVTVVLDEWKRGVQDEMRRRAQQAGSAPPQPTAPDPNSPPNPTGTPPFGLPPKATP